MLIKFAQVGGIVGGVAIILHQVWPILLPEGLPLREDTVWVAIVTVTVALLVFRGYYRFIEKASLIMIGLFTLLTIASVVVLQSTQYAVSFSDIAGGLQFKLPAAILITAIGAFGITGVGGDEIMTYNYWLLEKGYAAKTGPRDDSPDWERRARGWIGVMYWDAILSMVVYTVVTAAFYVLGAAVLHAQELVPSGTVGLIETLGKMYTETLGPWAYGVFLAGAIFVLFSTLFAALAGWTRLYSDCFARVGLFDFEDAEARRKWVAALAWIIPTLWALMYLIVRDPGKMVIAGGVATSLILLIVVFAGMQFRYRRLPKSLHPGRSYDVALWLSAVVIVGAAIYAVVVKALDLS